MAQRWEKRSSLRHASLAKAVGQAQAADTGRVGGAQTHVRLEVERAGERVAAWRFLSGELQALSLPVTHREKQTPRKLSQLGSPDAMAVHFDLLHN